MIVIGTAGHIDHGKSSIVKRITGTDPDRLPEEKARGMTIDLGFAFYTTPARQDIAFVDVPGHERFVKNMIAGAGGIDVAMIVVAADDGWMPQTEEHVEIIRLLGIRHAVVVINKIDLADSHRLKTLESEIRQRLANIFTSQFPIFPVSAQSGQGFAELIKYLDSLPAAVSPRADFGKARLAIDRSFTQTGIGAVVTGTLRTGTLTVGQTVSVWPGLQTGKIRSLQTKGMDVQRATPGQRTAVTVGGVERDQLIRGGQLSQRLDLSYFVENPVLILFVELLDNSGHELIDRRRVVLLTGTDEQVGEIRMFEQSRIAQGQQGLCFFRPDRAMYALVYDRFILRMETPMLTLGGGTVLDHVPQFPRRKDLSRFEYLKSRLSGDLVGLIKSELVKLGAVPASSFLESAAISNDIVNQNVKQLIERHEIILVREHLILKTVIDDIAARLTSSLRSFLTSRPHLRGMPVDLVQNELPYSASASEVLLEFLTGTQVLSRNADGYALKQHTSELTGIFREIHASLLAALRAAPYTPQELAPIAAKGKVYQHVIKYLIDNGEVYKCGSEFLILTPVWEEILSFVKEHLTRNAELNVASLKTRFGFTRKYAIPILEELDARGVTQRAGDVRIKGPAFETKTASL